MLSAKNIFILLVTLVSLGIFTVQAKSDALPENTFLAKGSNSYSESQAKIIQTWQHIQENIQSNKIKQAEQLIDELVVQRNLLGFEHMSVYAVELVKSAEAFYIDGDIEVAYKISLLARKLAPNTAQLELALFRLEHLMFGLGHSIKTLGKLIAFIPKNVGFTLQVFKGLIFPAMWVGVFSLLTLILYTFIYDFHLLARKIAKLLPHNLNGFLTPIVLLVALLCPIAGGPIATTLVWSIFLLIFLPQRRNLVLASGLLFLILAALIPLRAQLKQRLADGQLRELIAANASDYSASNLVMHAKEDNLNYPGATWFYFSQTRIKENNYIGAEQALEYANKYYGKASWLVAQQGAVALLTGDRTKAERYLQQAFDLGERSASLLYNLSYLRFSLMDIEASSKLLAEARKKDVRLVERLEAAREKGQPLKSSIAFGALPLTVFYKEIATSIYSNLKSKSSYFHLFLPRSNQLLFLIIGVVLLFAALFTNTTKVQRGVIPYSSWKPGTALKISSIFPGMLSIKQNLIFSGLIWVFSIYIMIMFLIGWPADFLIIRPTFAAIIPLVGATILLLVSVYFLVTTYQQKRVK